MGCRWSRVRISPPRPIETRVDSESSRVFVSPRFPSQDRHCVDFASFGRGALQPAQFPSQLRPPTKRRLPVLQLAAVRRHALPTALHRFGGPTKLSFASQEALLVARQLFDLRWHKTRKRQTSHLRPHYCWY